MKSMRRWVTPALAIVTGYGCYLFAKPPDTPAGVVPLGAAPAGSLALPDLDHDGKPEALAVLPAGQGQFVARLHSTNGPADSLAAHQHELFAFPAVGPLVFKAVAPVGDGPGVPAHWTMTDASGWKALDVRLYNPGGADALPELVVVGGGRGRRFLFIERGFMKLDAHEIVPGFSVGLVMLGDPESLIETIGPKPKPDGTWAIDGLATMPMVVGFEKGRVSRVTSSSSRLHIKNGPAIGEPAKVFSDRYPGESKARSWSSARYGLIGHLDEKGNLAALSVARPWKAPEPKSEPKPVAKPMPKP